MIGYPDQSTAYSFTKKFVQSLNLGAGSLIGPWDCLVFFTPLACSSTIAMRVLAMDDTKRGLVEWTSASGVVPGANIGFLTVVKGDAGTSLWPPERWAAGTTCQGIPIATSDLDGVPFRCIAGGFELTNTSPVINQSGSATVGTTTGHQGQSEFSVFETASGLKDLALFTRLCAPPGDINAARTHPSARTWQAMDGAYVPIRFTSEDQKARSFIPGIATIGLPDINTVPSVHLIPCTNIALTTTTIGSLTQTAVAQFQSPVPDIGMSYCYLSNLSNESSFDLVLKTFLECFPDFDKVSIPDMMSSCAPSPAYDPLALEIYATLVPSLPCGVPKTMNPTGEYFKLALKTFSDLASMATPLAAAIDPLAGVIVGGVGTAAGVAAQAISMLQSKNKSNNNNNKNKNKNKQKQTPPKKKPNPNLRPSPPKRR